MAFMVQDFGYSEAELGKYVGVLAASFGFGQMCSSLMWGRLSDKYGRKPVLLFGTFSAGMCMLIFGSSKTYGQAVLGRYLSGFLSGNLGVLKSVLAESTDDSNRIQGFGMISNAWFAGVIISPLAGGLLSGRSSSVSTGPFSWLTNEYPYLLPCIVCCMFNVVATIVAYFALTETRWEPLTPPKEASTSSTIVAKARSVRDIEMSSEHDLLLSKSNSTSDLGPGPRSTTSNSGRGYGSVTASLAPAEELDDERTRVTAANSRANSSPDKRRRMPQPTKRSSGTSNSSSVDSGASPGMTLEGIEPFIGDGGGGATPRSSLELLQDRWVLLTTVNYGLLIFGTILVDESIPLLLKFPRDHGGLECTKKEIGLLLSGTGSVVMFYCIILLPLMESFNKKRMFTISSLGMIPAVLGYPALATLYHYYPVDSLLWVLLITDNIMRNVFTSIVFTVCMIQVNNTVKTHELGAVNGIGQLFASTARCIGPAIGGLLWSFGVSRMDLYLNFTIVSVIMCCSCAINNYLPPSLETELQ